MRRYRPRVRAIEFLSWTTVPDLELHPPPLLLKCGDLHLGPASVLLLQLWSQRLYSWNRTIIVLHISKCNIFVWTLPADDSSWQADNFDCSSQTSFSRSVTWVKRYKIQATFYCPNCNLSHLSLEKRRFVYRGEFRHWYILSWIWNELCP